MASSPPVPTGRRVRVVLSSTALLSFTSVWKAAAFSIAELCIGAYFVVGLGLPVIGSFTPWFVLAVCLLAWLVRAIDIESWSLFVPGGLSGRAERAFGIKAGRIASAAVLVERLLLTALACAVVGQYAASLIVRLPVGGNLTPAAADLPSGIAAVLLVLLWVRARLGLSWPPSLIARGVWIAVGILTLTSVWGVLSLVSRPSLVASLTNPILPEQTATLPKTIVVLLGLALALPALGGGDALARAASELRPPRVVAIRRTAWLVGAVMLIGTVIPAFLFTLLVPDRLQLAWAGTPLIGLVSHLAGPASIRLFATLVIVSAAMLALVPVAHAALAEAEQVVRRLSADRVLPEALGRVHPRFGTLAHAIAVTAGAAILLVLVSGGRVEWLGRAYAFSLATALLIKIAALAKLRWTMREPPPFRTPLNVRIGRREIPCGLIGTGVILVSSMLVMLVVRDPATIAGVGLLISLAVLFTVRGGLAESTPAAGDRDVVELLPSIDIAVDQVAARPGNLLVPVRNPHALVHLAAALQAPGDRDVVVMTVRLLGVDVDPDDEMSRSTAPTAAERELFSRIVQLAERHGRPIHLLIVPARNVFDALVATLVRLRSAEIYVGESSTLSADDQARLLGDAWENADKPRDLDVRLVIYHRSGRSDVIHLGAHPPTLTPGDLDLIHRVWLDAIKAIGPHVHHRDVVRAALMQMEQQLDSAQRDQSLQLIREVARPADELAAAIAARDFSRLRDMVRNRHAADLATLLTDLSLEDQVVFFRVLPRKDAAAVFEYLSHEAQETLLKAMGHEEIAALLNNMAPDDRTMFLEELPAAATRQLLGLLSPAERAVALTLLGYPEDSIGRLMTPNYVAVREHWTVREVLDYIRTHGQDSETLNVVYSVDENGLLVDDIRIRELLLTALDTRISDLMDRHFIALKASDDQQTAVAAFRKNDRTALPVTDTAGMLIGIVTIDDVLDVAEEAATDEIQRFGGSEALDEPYMEIAFGRMVRKRAGWLTALFLGEMLTATAMGAYEMEISKAVVLALFVPLIISSGGNSGSQASTLVIRALALGEVGLGDWWRVMRREILAGLVLGSILGSIGFFRITMWSAFSTMYGPHWLLVAITVAVTLLFIVLWGTLVGSLLPFVLRRLGFDPATSSAPFVATLVDVTGLVIYFSVALLILRGTLL